MNRLVSSLVRRGVVWGLVPVTVWETVFYLLPMTYLVLASFWEVRDLRLLKTWTLENYRLILFDATYYSTYFRSLGLALSVVLITMIAAYPLAYALVFTIPARYRRLCLIAIVIPFWTSYLIRAYSWQIILGDTGLINQLLQALGVIEQPVHILFTHTATRIGLTHFCLPLMTLNLYAVMENIDPHLLEAASDLGARRWRTFYEVILPLSLPGLVIGSMLVFIFAFADFITPSLLGGGTKPVLPQLVVDALKNIFDVPMASALSMLLVATVFLVFLGLLRWVNLDRLRL